MTNTTTNRHANVPLIYPITLSKQRVDSLLALIAKANIPLTLTPVAVEQKINQKLRKQLCAEYKQPMLMFDAKGQLSLLTGQMSVAPAWHSLQRRVVSAGRKSELLLQACKLNEGQRVLDATAGFGHDSLILASTGAQVVMLERNPIMALLLLYEQQSMAIEPNWKKLMQRLEIYCADAVDYMQQLSQASIATSLSTPTSLSTVFDVVYLDPMFPDNSYTHARKDKVDHANTSSSNHKKNKKNKEGNSKGAKVGKHMQALHKIALPPNSEEEQTLLQLALASVGAIDGLTKAGRVVVKRPVAAPLFANIKADEQWQNDVLRFDAYFAHI
ncbi:class I SAM-dependent methyltransferase [Psychrobacter lutiphocae]|uniref:class I SAM-dependent methyltransferase n=1 Tax=Psychrobacter lutiphocae TaxID=540500 RepID=UPI000381EB3B|nr:class I SAM-dependent methyltransferase [Psychrobacter lutiphocae]